MPLDLSKKNNYEILGVTAASTDEEVAEAYKKLKAKYSEDRFLPGDAGNDAAEMLEAVEQAYSAIQTERNIANTDKSSERETKREEPKNTSNQETKSDDADYAEVDRLIKAGKIDEAQQKLDECSERRAEWHYLQAVIYYKKNWGNECKKQLEIAMTKEPSNAKYKESYDKLCKELDFKNKNFTSGNAAEGKNAQTAGKDFDPYDRQMGGDPCLNSLCQCLACNMLLNCCCRCR